jgi:hypothetical protein
VRVEAAQRDSIERNAEERAYGVIMVCEVGTELGSGKVLRRACVFIHPSIHSTFIKLYARYRVGEEVRDLRGGRVKRGSLGGSR